MYKEMIEKACEIMEDSTLTFTEKDKQAICFYAYKTGDLDKVKAFVSELDQATSRYAYTHIFEKYYGELEVVDSLETLAEKTLVYIERYRLEQECAISYLKDMLQINGISITEEELRNMDIKEITEKIKEKATR